MYCSWVSSVMRNLEPGYSASFERKKQYVQSRLQTAPVGLVRTWKDGGAVLGRGSGEHRQHARADAFVRSLIG